MELEDSLQEFAIVAQVFDELGIKYQLGGSVASSYYGSPRSTVDVDVEAEFTTQQAADFVKRLEDRYIITEEMIFEAIERGSCFNLIPFDAVAKIDVFIKKSSQYDLVSSERGRFGMITGDGATLPFWVGSPEDVILRKLHWYRLGNEVSTQKWQDVINVLKAQKFDLDLNYLKRWAAELGISDLLERAFDESGLLGELGSEK